MARPVSSSTTSSISGGTLCNAADALLAHGAQGRFAYITHGVLSGGAVARITASKLKQLVINRFHPADRGGSGVTQYPRALDRPLIGEAVAARRAKNRCRASSIEATKFQTRQGKTPA